MLSELLTDLKVLGFGFPLDQLTREKRKEETKKRKLYLEDCSMYIHMLVGPFSSSLSG